MASWVGELFQHSAVTVGSVFNSRLSTMATNVAQRRVDVFKPSSLAVNMGCTFRSKSETASHAWAHRYGWNSSRLELDFGVQNPIDVMSAERPLAVFRAGPESATPVKPTNSKKKNYPGEAKGFVEEMRFVAMKLHTKDQSKEGEKEDASVQPVAKWQPSVNGYLNFLVNSQKVYDTLEEIVATAAHPSYAEFRNTGLERCGRLAKDLDWFGSEGYEIPPVGEEGNKYAELLKSLSESDPPAFICHFYNVYFAHFAGGKFIGRKVAELVLDNKELEFYKWDGDLQTLLANVKAKLNMVADGWTRDQKNHCLDETELSFKYSGKLLRLIVS